MFSDTETPLWSISENSTLILYLISLLLKMDSKVKVDFMVKTMLEDPNTNEETKKLIAELLTIDQFQKDDVEMIVF